MERACSVNSGEDLAVRKPRQVILDVGKSEGVLDGDFIQLPIVNYPSGFSVFLRDSYQRETPGRRGGLDHVLLQPQIKLFLEFSFHDGVNGPSLGLDGRDVLGADLVFHKGGSAVLISL